MKLSDFRGENVTDAVSMIKGAVSLLENNGSALSDITDIAFKIMRSSATSEFSTHVTTMKTNHETGVLRVTLPDFLLNVQEKYNELSLEGEWETGTSNEEQGSIFGSLNTCYNCGQEGHH